MLEATQPETALASTAAPEAQPVDATPPPATPYPEDQPRQPEEPDPEPEVQPEVEEQVEEAQETDLPPIDAPASWAKDAKEQFASLPREAQEIIAQRENARDLEVRRAQSAVQTERQRAEREAFDAVAQIKQQTAQQLQRYAQQFSAPEPDLRLLQSNDPEHHAIYMQQERAYKLDQAQRAHIEREAQEAMRDAQALEQQRTQVETQAEVQALLQAIPEWADPTQRANLISELEPIGAGLGYSTDDMANAGAKDILALRTALSWKRDADELRSIKNKAKMVPVRAARQIPPAGRVAAPSGNTAKPVGTLAQLYPDDVPK